MSLLLSVLQDSLIQVWGCSCFHKYLTETQTKPVASVSWQHRTPESCACHHHRWGSETRGSLRAVDRSGRLQLQSEGWHSSHAASLTARPR